MWSALLILFDLLKNAVCIPCLINSSLRLHCSSRPQQLFIDSLVIQWPHLTLWLFIDPLDGPIDPWGSISTTLRTTALDHNVWTLIPNRSSKVSKDMDCSLVSNKNISEILPSNGLGLGEVGQGGLKALHLMSLIKNLHAPTKKFFSSSV